jgi:tetratricopeptide (TPR) repeat protein
MDFLLPFSICQDLMHKAEHSPCILCRNECAFQVSVCATIGLGLRNDSRNSNDDWLVKSKRTQEDLKKAIEELGSKYKYPGHVSKDVLNALGIGVLVSSDRIQEYQTSGRLIDAQQIIQDQIQARLSNFGDSHLIRAKCESEMSKILQAQLRFKEAEEHELQTAKILRGQFGDRHPSVLMANVTLADLYAKQGLLRKAHGVSSDTQPLLEEVLGVEHPETISAHQVHAIIQYELGLAKAAEESMRKVVGVRTKTLTAAHPFTVRAELSLATVLRAQGRLVESKELVAAIHNKLINQLAGDYLSKAEVYLVWAALESEAGSLDDALRKITEGLAAMDMVRLPATSPLRLDGLEILASIYGKAKELEKQEATLRQVLEVKKTQDTRNREISTTVCLLAGCLLAQNRWDEASNLADEALAGMGRSIAEDHRTTWWQLTLWPMPQAIMDETKTLNCYGKTFCGFARQIWARTTASR